MNFKPDVKVVEDSISPTGKRITTLQLRYVRFIHAEFMTHLMFSRNAASSRATPVKKMLAQVWNNPACPRHWGLNEAWMQANKQAEGIRLVFGKWIWKLSNESACIFAYLLSQIGGFHKQVANRILEPYQQIHVVLTSTEWDNFFNLRIHPAAQPEMQDLAIAIYSEITRSTPKQLKRGQWHLPYVSQKERITHRIEDCLKMSAARCARVSTMNHDGTHPTIGKDADTYHKLVDSVPMHASPLEHQATPFDADSLYQKYELHFCRNFKGWIQHRALFENETVINPMYVEPKRFK